MKYDKVVKNIFLDALKDKKLVTLCANGQSMWPFIKNGDVLTLEDSCGTMRLGDVAIVNNYKPDRFSFMCHRIVKIQKGKDQKIYCLKGDNLESGSDMLFSENDIKGKVILVNRSGLVYDYRKTYFRFINYMAALLSSRMPELFIFFKRPINLILEWPWFLMKVKQRFYGKDEYTNCQ